MTGMRHRHGSILPRHLALLISAQVAWVSLTTKWLMLLPILTHTLINVVKMTAHHMFWINYRCCYPDIKRILCAADLSGCCLQFLFSCGFSWMLPSYCCTSGVQLKVTCINNTTVWTLWHCLGIADVDISVGLQTLLHCLGYTCCHAPIQIQTLLNYWLTTVVVSVYQHTLPCYRNYKTCYSDYTECCIS